jgi:hypothetical protein
MFNPRTLLPLLCGILVLAAGCSSRKPLAAVVTLDGKAVEGATVVLTKTGGGGGAPISGLTDASGNVLLDTAAKEGVAPGDYKVSVTKVKAQTTGIIKPGDPEATKLMMKGAKAAKTELPDKYANASSSDITLKVPPDTTPAKIELKGK